jgi:hypothetical protein
MTVDPGLLGYCQAARRCNLSANFALDLYRRAGGTVKRTTFLEAWRAAGAAERSLVYPGTAGPRRAA